MVFSLCNATRRSCCRQLSNQFRLYERTQYSWPTQQMPIPKLRAGGFFASSELYIFLQVRLIARQFVVDHLYDGLGRKLHPNFHSIVARRDLDTLQ